MRESIGTVSLLNFIIFFIFLVFAFLMGTFSYYKAYRVNNSIVAAIEKYEGYNRLSMDEINIKLNNLGYSRERFNCRNKNGAQLMESAESADGTVNGYCIYSYDNDVTDGTPETEVYDSYEVTTIITFQFPVIQDILKLQVSSRTNRIYNFQKSCENFQDGRNCGTNE